MKVFTGFAVVASLLVGLAIGLNMRPYVDEVDTFNDGFLTALCAPTPDNPAIWQDGAGVTCIPQ